MFFLHAERYAFRISVESFTLVSLNDRLSIRFLAKKRSRVRRAPFQVNILLYFFLSHWMLRCINYRQSIHEILYLFVLSLNVLYTSAVPRPTSIINEHRLLRSRTRKSIRTSVLFLFSSFSYYERSNEFSLVSPNITSSSIFHLACTTKRIFHFFSRWNRHCREIFVFNKRIQYIK